MVVTPLTLKRHLYKSSDTQLKNNINHYARNNMTTNKTPILESLWRFTRHIISIISVGINKQSTQIIKLIDKIYEKV